MNKKIGYYTVGNQIFEKKIQALIYATKIFNALKTNGKLIDPKTLVKWNFNDDVFSQYDWTKEPDESLKQLYYKRARYLREKYDYIVISYSGGSDCHNIVTAFLEQGLHIDELVVVSLDKGAYDVSIDEKNTSAVFSHASENKFQAIPRLKEIKDKSPGTNIKYVDMTNLVFDVFSKNKDASWILNMREELNPVDVTRYNYSYFPEFRKTLDRFQNVGVLVGIDKPRIIIDSDTKFVYTRFLDRLTNIIPIKEYIQEYTNTTVEFFYWSPDACDVLCKQAHVVKKWLEINESIQFFYETKPKYHLTYDQIRIFNERILRSILYDNWNPNWFQSDKPRRDWFTEADNWFIKGAIGTKEHSIWLQGIKYVIDNTTPFLQKWGNTPDSFMHWHKDYCIGKLNKFVSNV